MTKVLFPIILLFSTSCDLTRTKKDDHIITNDANKIYDLVVEQKFKIDLTKYQNSNCPSDTLTKTEYLQNFEGIKELGDLDSDGKTDYVYILNPLNKCEDGQSYYFSNPSVERIATESYCCHLSSIINIGDINEDGLTEIAEYYSSCVSKYKAITVHSLTSDLSWREIVTFSYALNDQFPIEKYFQKLIVKKSKNVFEYFEIKDVDINGKLVASWKSIRIE